jgi:CHAT domain-containing protein/tetratricopeptide (TPR) repeat protein
MSHRKICTIALLLLTGFAIPLESLLGLNPAQGLPFHTSGISSHGSKLEERRSGILAQGTAETADDLFQQGMTYQQQQQLDRAIQVWQEAANLYQRQQDNQGLLKTYEQLSFAYENQQNYQKAVESFLQLLDLAKKTGDQQRQGVATGSLGNNYFRLGFYGQAIEAYQESLTIWQTLGNQASQGLVFRGLGNVYIVLGNYSQARELHQKALDIALATNNTIGLAYSYNSLGAIDLEEGDNEQARTLYQKSLDTARVVEDETVRNNLMMQAFNNLGAVELSEHNFEASQDYFDQSLTIAQGLSNPNLSSQASALRGLGAVYTSLDQGDKALNYVQQGLDIAQKLGDQKTIALSLHLLGATYWKMGNLAEASRYLKEALTILEDLHSRLSDIDKVSLFDTQIHSYFLLRRILAEQGQYEAALEISERSRSRAFLELLNKRFNQNSGRKSNVTAYESLPTLNQIREIAKQEKATIVEYGFVADEDFIASGKLFGNYIKILIWVVHPDGKIDFAQVDLDQVELPQATRSLSLANLITAARCFDDFGCRRYALSAGRQSLRVSAQVTGRSPFATAPRPAEQPTEGAAARPRNNPFLQALHQLLIEPIEAYLPTDPDAHVIFIPQRELFLVPFPALQNADGQFLIERHTVLTAPSIEVLGCPHRQHQALGNASGTAKMLVVGNPDMPTLSPEPGIPASKLNALPYAEKEAQAIASFFHITPLIGTAATKSKVIAAMEQSRFIHLATHGSADDSQELNSWIALAPDANFQPKGAAVNGLLTANEILDLNLKADLVVLSACETGEGWITGDGVVGLSRSFLAAGASSVLVSLWPISDESTAQLMQVFYETLAEKPDKAYALRQAMLNLLQGNYSDPSLWSAFTLIGEAESGAIGQ